MTTPLQRVQDALARAGAHRSGPAGWTCPAHNDRQASLSVSQGRDGRVLINCHAGCDVADILHRLDLTKRDLFPPKEEDRDRPIQIAAYDYTDERGELLFQAVRYTPKMFRQRRRPRPTDPQEAIKRDGWVYNLQGTRRVLYRLPQVLDAAKADREIWIAEGEKDVHALEALEAVATCNPMGAGKWRTEYSEVLAGATLVVVADLDDTGREHALTVARSLRAAGCRVRVVQAATGKDPHDHLSAGLTLDAFLPLEEEQTEAGPNDDQPTAGEPAPLAVEIHDFLDSDDPEYDWLIPGLLERGDRVILTGPEGGGKSTLLQQFVIQAGAGIHPFAPERIEPIRVLYVDLENSPAHVRRQLRPLKVQAGTDLDHDHVYVTVEPSGLDLLNSTDVEWLVDRVKESSPALVIIGPLYKMAAGDPTAEEVARKTSAALDELRTTHSFALMIEAHVPHAPAGGRRPTRPYGASMWLRWPEYGIYLGEGGQLTHWRGQRDERDWPKALKRGGTWPWGAEDNPREELWKRIESFVHDWGHTASQRRLVDELKATKGSVQRAIEAHRDEWELMRKTFGDLP